MMWNIVTFQFKTKTSRRKTITLQSHGTTLFMPADEANKKLKLPISTETIFRRLKIHSPKKDPLLTNKQALTFSIC